MAFSLGHPGLGPRRIAAQLARPEWGGLAVSPNGVWKVLRRHGISNTRAKRLALIAGYRAPYEPPREPAPEPHIDTARPGELVGIDCFFVGRLHGHQGRGLADHRDRYLQLSFAWADLVRAPRPGPDRRAHHHARAAASPRELPTAGWRLERVLSDNGNEFRSRDFAALPRRARRPPQPHPRRTPADQRPRRAPAPHDPRGVLAPRLRALPTVPAYTGLKRHLDAYITYYNHHRAHTGRTDGRTMPGRPRLRCPQDGAEMSRTCRHNSESVQPNPSRIGACHIRLATSLDDLADGRDRARPRHCRIEQRECPRICVGMSERDRHVCENEEHWLQDQRPDH